MEGTVDQFDVKIHYRVAGDDAVGGGFKDAVQGRFDVFLGNGTADNFVLGGDALAAFGRIHFDHHMTVLATAPGLFDQLTLTVGRDCGALAISDLGLAGIHFHLEFAEHAVADNFEV